MHEQERGRQFDMPLCYMNLGLVQWNQGKLAEAKHSFSECLRSVVSAFPMNTP